MRILRTKAVCLSLHLGALSRIVLKQSMLYVCACLIYNRSSSRGLRALKIEHGCIANFIFSVSSGEWFQFRFAGSRTCSDQKRIQAHGMSNVQQLIAIHFR